MDEMQIFRFLKLQLKYLRENKGFCALIEGVIIQIKMMNHGYIILLSSYWLIACEETRTMLILKQKI